MLAWAQSWNGLHCLLWEMSVLVNRQRDIIIVQRQPLAPGRLALSCRDNRVTSPSSRQRRQMATSFY